MRTAFDDLLKDRRKEIKKSNIIAGQVYEFIKKMDVIDDVFYVRGFVDGMVVIRYWNKNKRRWDYEVRDPGHFRRMKDLIRLVNK